MKVLWTANLIPANAAEKLGLTAEVLGGWVESMLAELNKHDDIKLAVSCKCDANLKFYEEIDGISYYSLGYLPSTEYNELEKSCLKIIENFNPDIINIEGTEFIHAKAMMSAAEKMNIPVVVSMKGVLNGQYRYQCGDLLIDDMMFSGSLTDIFAAWILHLRKRIWFRSRLESEKEIIGAADYIIGRTTWDRAHSYALNPNLKYFYCSENLREPFYHQRWDIKNIERHSIYVGNSYHALKGFHFLVMALPQLIKEYPDIKVYVAGYKPYDEKDKRSFIKKGYAAYLKKLINDLGVENYIEFTGPLKAEQVAKKLSNVNAYVLCSAVENSPNTLGEAMLVGTPCVSAYVGGVPDMAKDGEEAILYRNDDPALLAWSIKRIFDSDELAQNLSVKGHLRASSTHDKANNALQLMEIYKSIIYNSKVKK